MSEGWTEIFHLCPTGSPMVTDTTLIENIFLYKPLSKRAEFYVPTKPQFHEVIIPSNMLTGFFWLVVHHRLYSTTLHLTIISWDVPMNLSVEKWISFLGTGFKCSVRSGSADIAATQCDSHCSIVLPCTCLLHFGHQMHQQQPDWDLSQCRCGW